MSELLARSNRRGAGRRVGLAASAMLLVAPIISVLALSATSTPAGADVPNPLGPPPVVGQPFASIDDYPESKWDDMEPGTSVQNWGPESVRNGAPLDRHFGNNPCPSDATETGWQLFPDSVDPYPDDRDQLGNPVAKPWVRNPDNPYAYVYDAARVCYQQLPGRVVVKSVEYAQLQFGCDPLSVADGIDPHQMWRDVEYEPDTFAATIGPYTHMATRFMTLMKNTDITSYSCRSTFAMFYRPGTDGLSFHYGPVMGSQWTAVGEAPDGSQFTLVNENRPIYTIPPLYEGTYGHLWSLKRVGASAIAQPAIPQMTVVVDEAELSGYQHNADGQPDRFSGHRVCCDTFSHASNRLRFTIQSDVPPDPGPVPTPVDVPPTTPTTTTTAPPPTTLPDHAPSGAFESVRYTGTNDDIEVKGWASDPEAPSGGVNVVFWSRATGQTLGTATTGTDTRFTKTFPMPQGLSDTRVCAAVKNVGSQGVSYDAPLVCRAVGTSPYGVLERDVYDQGDMRVHFSGWAKDDDAPNDPVRVDFVADNGRIIGTTSAGLPRAVVGNHGFDALVLMPPELQGFRICAVARDLKGSLDRTLVCDIPATMAVGNFEAISHLGLNQYELEGWAAEPGRTGPSPVYAFLDDGEVRDVFDADLPRNDVALALPGIGANHGFARTLMIPAGTHKLCLAVGATLNGLSKDLGCRTVFNDDAMGTFDAVSRTGPNSYTVSGWAIDPDVQGPLDITVRVDDGTPQRADTTFAHGADQYRADLAAANDRPYVRQYGGAHGYTLTVGNVSLGVHQVCVYANNAAGSPGAATVSLGCKSVGSASGPPPVGALDSADGPQLNAGAATYRLTGWALDPDSSASVDVQAVWDLWTSQQSGTYFVNGASLPRADLATRYPYYGVNHGFDVRIPTPATPGTHKLCMIAFKKTTGPNGIFGCRDVVTTAHDPLGSLEATSVAGPGTARVVGWSLDPDQSTPIDVHIYVDGVGRLNLTAPSVTRTDIGARYPGYGDAHGFDAVVSGLSAGTHNVCAYAINQAAGTGINPSLGCQSVVIPGGDPFGHLDLAQIAFAGGKGIRVAGWTLDPDTATSTDAHVYVDGVGAANVKANLGRSDIDGLYPGYGALHGYDTTVLAAVGVHQVCVFAIGLDAAGALTGNNPQIGCASVTVSSEAMGSLDLAQASTGGIRVAGWAMDPDTAGSTWARITVDGTIVATPVANLSRADIGATYSGYGVKHGYDTVVAATSGTHVVCVYALGLTTSNTFSGSNPQIGCRSVTV